MKLNPRGLVPTLAVEVPFKVSDNGSTATNGHESTQKKSKPLYESIVIAEYLDEHYPDEQQHGPRLLPAGNDTLAAYERARCRLWIDHISSRIVPAFYRFLQHTPEKDYSIADVRDEFLKHIKTLFQEMLELDKEREELGSRPGPWFLGANISLVDITLIPWMLRLFLIDHYKPGGVGIPEPGTARDDDLVWDRFRSWEKAIHTQDSVLATMSDKDKYIDVYKRYAEDKTGSQVGQNTRSGRGLP